MVSNLNGPVWERVRRMVQGSEAVMAEIAIGSRVQICAFSGAVAPQESAKRKSGRYVRWAEMDGAEGTVRGAAPSSLVVDIASKDAARSGHITVPVGALKPVPKEAK